MRPLTLGERSLQRLRHLANEMAGLLAPTLSAPGARAPTEVAPRRRKLPGFTHLLIGASNFSLTPVPQDVATIVAG